MKEIFDENKCFSLVPILNPDKIDALLEMFEKTAKGQWVTLTQRSLTGKAKQAYVAMKRVRWETIM